MSWSFNYLKRLKNEIERYKDQMMFMINPDQNIDNQDGLVKLSQELDKHILNYQNYNRILNSYQNEPYSVDFYMNTTFCRVRLSKDGLISISPEQDKSEVIIVNNYQGKIEGLIKGKFSFEPSSEFKLKINRNFSLCQTGSSIWLANIILDQKQCNYIIVVDFDGNPKGILHKEQIKRLCGQKTLNGNAKERLVKIEHAFDNVPVSIFVLDNQFFIEYANTEAIKNFNEILPRNYLFKKADLVFSSLLNNSYQEFIQDEFWTSIINRKNQSGIDIKLLNYINLVANIKTVKNSSGHYSVIISFMNVDELRHKVEELTFTSDELSQALSLFLPYDIEKELRRIPEYKDIYNYDTEKITVISRIKDGGYWHVINCLRILSQIDRLGILGKYRIDKDLLIQAIVVHDVGKQQPDLDIGDTVDPKNAFESGKKHAMRSARYCTTKEYKKSAILLVKYHHHNENELPPKWSKRFLLTFRIFKMIDGLSAAITRRNATISFELKNDSLHIYEENKERPEYCKVHVLDFEINPSKTGDLLNDNQSTASAK